MLKLFTYLILCVGSLSSCSVSNNTTAEDAYIVEITEPVESKHKGFRDVITFCSHGHLLSMTKPANGFSSSELSVISAYPACVASAADNKTTSYEILVYPEYRPVVTFCSKGARVFETQQKQKDSDASVAVANGDVSCGS